MGRNETIKKVGNVTESPVVIGTELGIDSWRAKSTCKVAQEFPKGRRGKKMLTGKSVPLFAVANESVATGKMDMAGQTNAALDIDEVNDNLKKRFPISPVKFIRLKLGGRNGPATSRDSTGQENRFNHSSCC